MNFAIRDGSLRIQIWVWRRLVARYLGVVEAAGSNPVTQTMRSVLVGFENGSDILKCWML